MGSPEDYTILQTICNVFQHCAPDAYTGQEMLEMMAGLIREVQTGELAVIFFGGAVVSFRCLDFVLE